MNEAQFGRTVLANLHRAKKKDLVLEGEIAFQSVANAAIELKERPFPIRKDRSEKNRKTARLAIYTNYIQLCT